MPPQFSDAEPPARLAPAYSPKKSLVKGGKVGLAAAVGWLLADPNLLPALTEAIPPKYRMLAAVAVPWIWSTAANWHKQNRADA